MTFTHLTTVDGVNVMVHAPWAASLCPCLLTNTSIGLSQPTNGVTVPVDHNFEIFSCDAVKRHECLLLWWLQVRRACASNARNLKEPCFKDEARYNKSQGSSDVEIQSADEDIDYSDEDFEV